MTKIDWSGLILTTLFLQENLLTLQKQERHTALDSLNKMRQMTWNQFYQDGGLKWEKIISVKPPTGIDTIYSLRITQARQATAYRDGDFIRILTIAPNHDFLWEKVNPT